MTTTAVSSKLLSELEQEIDQLKTENFDLKMQLYYATNSKLKNNLNESPSHLTIYEDDENIELNNYKNENERLRNKINELELDLLELKIKKDKSTNNHNNNPFDRIQPTSSDIVLMEENRKRERQAALAIAEHDSAIISHLEKEIERLQSQHNTDVKLINQCADKVGILTDLLRNKEEEINKLQSDNNSLLQQIDVLNDKIKHRETIIKQNNSQLDNLKQDNNIILIGNKSLANTTVSDNEHSDDILKYGAQISIEELKRLRRENIILRDQIDRERSMLKSQEEILQRVRLSAEELTLLEAEEIARLEEEIDRLTKENEKLKLKYDQAESNAETHRQKLKEYERSHQHLLRFDSHNNSLDSDKDISAFSNHSKIRNNRQANSHNTEDAANHKNNDYNEQVIDMYKQRETELLNALDSVVRRCQALEKKNTKPSIKR